MPPFWPSVRLYPQHKVAAGGLFSRKALTEWQETEREVRPTSPGPHLDRANFSSVPRGVGFSGWLAAQPDRGHIGEMPARTGPCRRRPGMIERKAMLQKFFNAMTQKTGQTGERRSTAPIMSKDDGRPDERLDVVHQRTSPTMIARSTGGSSAIVMARLARASAASSFACSR